MELPKPCTKSSIKCILCTVCRCRHGLSRLASLNRQRPSRLLEPSNFPLRHTTRPAPHSRHLDRLTDPPTFPPSFFGGGLPSSSMPHTSKRSQPPSEFHRSASTARKRKLHAREHSAAEGSSPLARQQSISDIFSSQQKASSLKEDPGSYPTSKKHKTTSSSSNPAETPLRTMATTEMYHFPQKKSPHDAACIDLTSSPESSPKARRADGFHISKGPSGSLTTAKKLTVKNLRSPSNANPTDYLEQIWAKLAAALDRIFNEGKVTFPLEELYRGVENVCRQGYASTIHTRLKARCKKNVIETLKAPLAGKAAEKNVDVLRAVLAAWTRWRTQMVSLNHINPSRISVGLTYRQRRSLSNRFSTTWIDRISFNHQSLR